MPRIILLVLLALLPAARALAKPRSVSVVSAEPSTQGKAYRLSAEVVLALRQKLRKQGREVLDPTMALHSPTTPPIKLLIQARKDVKRAVDDYDSLEFTSATRGFAQAVARMREALLQTPDSVKTSEYIVALHYLGASTYYDGNLAGAAVHFRDAVSYSPETPFDDGVFPPDLVKVFDGVRVGLVANSSLSVTSQPGAEVFIDGKARGATPLKTTEQMAGRHLVRVQSPGYVPSARWIEVKADGQAEVSIELAEGDRLEEYSTAMAEARADLERSRPGRGITHLSRLLGAGSLILVIAADDGTVQATWAEGGFWTKRYQANVARGREPLFATRFFKRGGSIGQRVECRRDMDCMDRRQCIAGRCVASSASTPVYKKWWFWTIVGAAVVGGTVGAVVGTLPDKWNATVEPGVWP